MKFEKIIFNLLHDIHKNNYIFRYIFEYKVSTKKYAIF